MTTDAAANATWWRRAGGGAEVLTVALPLVASTLTWTAMTFTDRMILHWVSGTAMAASFSAGVSWFASLCLPLGICAYASTFVAQYHGDGQPRRIGPAVWQGAWLALLASPLLLALIPLAPSLFAQADHGPERTALEVQYFQILCWGSPGFLIGQALEGFYSGRGRTRVVMVVDIAAVLANLLLDLHWGLGWWGSEAYGLPGAAWATMVSIWVKCLIFVALVLQRANRKRFATWHGMKFDLELTRRLLRYGGPSGVQMLLDVGGFTVFVLMVGRINDVATEATSLVFSVAQLAFMPVWGCGIACSILVGQRLGEGRPELAERSARTTLQVALVYMAAVSILFLTAPALLFQPFFVFENHAGSDAAQVRALAARLLGFVAAYNLFDAVIITLSSALKGAGDTPFIMRVSMIMALTLATLTWFGVERLGWGVYSCWIVVTAWIWCLAVIYVVRFRQGKWKRMRVIQPQHHPAPAVEEAPRHGGSLGLLSAETRADATISATTAE